MTSPNTRQLSQNKGRLLLAKQAFQSNQILTKKRAAKSFDVARTTLRDRINGSLPQDEANAKKRKLLPTEEIVLVNWILDLDQRGFPPQLIDVRGMANTLLTERGQNPPPKPVGKCWVNRFITNQPKLKTQWNRKFHAQRANARTQWQ
jgi:Tc5 transposase DNA-binding domain